mgnify:CR=1 FL=1
MNGGYIFLIILVIILSICGITYVSYRFYKNNKENSLAELSKREFEVNRLDQEHQENHGESISPFVKDLYRNVPYKDLKTL